jgi:hypothetical protein
MMAMNPLQRGARAPQQNNELYSAGTLGISGVCMAVTSQMTSITGDIKSRHGVICRRKGKCLEKIRNPTLCTVQFTTMLTDSLIVPLTFNFTF